MGTLTVGQFEKLAAGIYLEGLAFDSKRSVVWYSDVITGGVHGLKPDGSNTVILNPRRMWTGGIMMNEDGAVLSTGEGGIMWNDPDTGKSGWLLNRLEGEPINGINEMMPDGTGGIYFGTNDIERVIRAQPTRPTALYRLTVDRQVIKLAEGINFSNGLMLSPDRKRFYCNDTFVGTWTFDVQPDLTLPTRGCWLKRPMPMAWRSTQRATFGSRAFVPTFSPASGQMGPSCPLCRPRLVRSRRCASVERTCATFTSLPFQPMAATA